MSPTSGLESTKNQWSLPGPINRDTHNVKISPISIDLAKPSKWPAFARVFGSGTAERPISHLVRTAAAARVQQILNHVIS